MPSTPSNAVASETLTKYGPSWNTRRRKNCGPAIPYAFWEAYDTLQLQFSQMSSAWRHHNPDDGNADNNATLACLERTMESTRVAVAHVLWSSGKAIAYRAPWRPEEPFDPDACPNPYTSLAQFHRKVMPFAHRDLPHARQPPRLGGAAGGADHMSTCNGQPDQVTCTMTPGRDGKATAQTSIPTRPNSMHVTKSAAAEASD